MFFSKSIMLFPLIAVMLLDGALTLACQPAIYWQDYNLCNEVNPVGRALLSLNPVCFAAFFILYAFVVLFFVLKARKPINILLVAGVLAAHIHGSASWLPNVFQNIFSVSVSGQFLYLIYVVVISAVYAFCFLFSLSRNPYTS